jgi:hypothetical protein
MPWAGSSSDSEAPISEMGVAEGPTTSGVIEWSSGAAPWVAILNTAMTTLSLSMPRCPVRIMTDCSGLEAPLLGCEEAGLNLVHVASCDVCPRVRAWIREHHSPQILFDDMLTRDLTGLLSLAPIDLYVCGFPCTPFSSRRTNATLLFDEPAARVFYATIQTLKRLQPRLWVLENVKGILRRQCRAEVDRELSALEHLGYTISWVMPSESSPKSFGGYPIERPRVFIVGFKPLGDITGISWMQRFQNCLRMVSEMSTRAHTDLVTFLAARGFNMEPLPVATPSLPCNCSLHHSCPRWPHKNYSVECRHCSLTVLALCNVWRTHRGQLQHCP